jgi:hypothetical protein
LNNESRDASEALDEDDVRVDRADLFFELSLAVRGDLPAEHDQVNVLHIESGADIREVIGRRGFVAEGAEAGEGVVEDELALADQQYAPLGGIAPHISSSLLG